MVDREIVMAKIDGIKRHMDRLKGIARLKEHIFIDNIDAQDVAVFNLQMAIQKCIDIGNHFYSEWDIGAPSSYSDVFDELRRRKIIIRAMSEKLIKMAGLRNRIAHEYEDIDLRKIHSFIKNNLKDFDSFLKMILKHM